MSPARLEQRLNKGRNALALARQKGMDTTPWEAILAKLEQEHAQQTVRRTEGLLATQGWCLWQCSKLDDEIIAVVRDDSIKDFPKGYSVYTKAELEEVARANTSAKTIRLIHEVKKHTNATVQSVIASLSGLYA